MFHPASVESLTAFVIICTAVVATFFGGVWVSARREMLSPVRRTFLVAISTILVLSAVILVVRSGWLRGDQRRLLLFAATMNALILGVGLSPVGRWLSLLPLPALVAFQGFRFPLELVLHSWAAQGVIPFTMTWSGKNWDIISGVLALAAAPFCRRSIVWAWLANVVGLVLLANVTRVAVLSSPVSFGWPVTPKLELVFHLP